MIIEVGRFLVWYKPWSSTKQLIEINIVEISKSSIKVRFVSGNERWITKNEFASDYKIQEQIMKESRYIATVDLHVWATSDQEAIQKTKKILARDEDFELPRLLKLTSWPFGKLEGREVEMPEEERLTELQKD